MKSIIETIITRGPVGWFRRLFYVVKVYGNQINHVARQVQELQREMQDAVRYIKRATKVHIDVGTDGKQLQSTAILCGRYRGKDHVQIFALPDSDCAALIDRLKHMQRAADIETIDAPHGLDATIKRSLKS